MEQQRIQFEQQMALQKAQAEEQKRIAEAPPPPAPQETAKVAASAAELPIAATTAAGAEMAIPARIGLSRRKLRTDVTSVAGGTGGLSIPGA